MTLDLNGFAILGPTVCTGNPPSCSPIGTGVGVFAAGGVDNITVVNGTVRGMGAAGVRLVGISHRVERVHATSNGSHGIELGATAIVTGNQATANHLSGILIGTASVVTGNTARENGGSGITASFGSTVSGNTAINNSGAGIFANAGSIAIGNAAIFNTGFGFQLGSNAGYSQNALTGNNGGSANPQVSSGINGGQNVCGTDAVCP